jgi:hypothetical protein
MTAILAPGVCWARLDRQHDHRWKDQKVVDFDSLRDKAEDFAKDHADQVESGIDKAADLLGNKVGHEEQIDKGAEKLKDLLPEKDGPAT